MGWNSIGDFTSLVGPDATPIALAVNEGFLYALVNPDINGPAELWRYNGSSWTQVATLQDYAIALKTWNSFVYTGTNPQRSFTSGGVWRYDESGGLVKELNDTGDAFKITSFAEYGSDLYFSAPNNSTFPFFTFSGEVYKRNGGSWGTKVDSSANIWTLGEFDSELYLSRRSPFTVYIDDGPDLILEFNGSSFASTVLSDGTGASVLFFDTFTDTNGTVLTAHSPDVGSGWSSILNNGEILFNEAIRSGGLDYVVVTDVSDSDVGIAVSVEDLLANSFTGNRGIIGRLQDSNNYWLFSLAYDPTLLIRIIEVNAGTPTVRAEADISITPASIDLFVSLNGNDLSFSAGEAFITYNSSFLNTETQHGLTEDGNAINPFDDFRIIDIPFEDIHLPSRRMVQFGADMYSYEGKYIHRWENGSSWSLDKTFDDDIKSLTGLRDIIVYDGKLWAGVGTSIWVRDGGTWAEDPDSDLGYQQEEYIDRGLGGGNDFIPFSYNPPIGFAEYDGDLYVCAAGNVYVREAAGSGYNVLGLGSAKEVNGDRLWVTVWKGTAGEIYLQSYDTTTTPPTLDSEFSMGAATEAQINAGSVIAYPYAPYNGNDGEVYIFGRFLYGGSETHVLKTTNAGSSFTIIEDGWGTDICGSMVRRGSRIYVVRNKPTLGHLYAGTNSLGFVSIMSFPVNPFGLDFNANFDELYAVNKHGGTPRVIASPYPFTNWSDISFNYPLSGQIKAVATID